MEVRYEIATVLVEGGEVELKRSCGVDGRRRKDEAGLNRDWTFKKEH